MPVRNRNTLLTMAANRKRRTPLRQPRGPRATQIKWPRTPMPPIEIPSPAAPPEPLSMVEIVRAAVDGLRENRRGPGDACGCQWCVDWNRWAP